MAWRTDGNQRYSWMKNRRSLLVRAGRHSTADGCQARNAVIVPKLPRVLSTIAATARDWHPESKVVQDTLSLREADQCSNNDNGHKNCDRDVSFRYSLSLTVSRCQPSALVIHESGPPRQGWTGITPQMRSRGARVKSSFCSPHSRVDMRGPCRFTACKPLIEC